MFAHSRDPHPAIELWRQVAFTKSKTIFQIETYCVQCFLKSKYIEIKFKKPLPHLATRGTYSPGDWRCDEAWREQTLMYPPVMCQQRLIYCTWELNVMTPPSHNQWYVFYAKEIQTRSSTKQASIVDILIMFTNQHPMISTQNIWFWFYLWIIWLYIVPSILFMCTSPIWYPYDCK